MVGRRRGDRAHGADPWRTTPGLPLARWGRALGPRGGVSEDPEPERKLGRADVIPPLDRDAERDRVEIGPAELAVPGGGGRSLATDGPA